MLPVRSSQIWCHCQGPGEFISDLGFTFFKYLLISVWYKLRLLWNRQSPDRDIILPKSQIQNKWLKLGVGPVVLSVLFEIWLQKNLCEAPCVIKKASLTREDEVRTGLTKGIIFCVECPRHPPLIHLPQLIWFPLMFQHLGKGEIGLAEAFQSDYLLIQL